MRRIPVLAAVVLLVATAVACGGDDDDTEATDTEATDGVTEATDTEATDGDTASTGGDSGGDTSITIALDAEPNSLDPQKTVDGQTRRVAENIFERLVDRDLNDPATLVPRLAAELPERIDDTTWEVKIRDGVEFTNGEPFDAAAAAAAINRMVDPEFDSDLYDQVSTISAAEAVDDQTLRITTVGPDPALPARLYMILMVPPEYSQTEEFARAPIGTGPYALEEWEGGTRISLQRNDDYWGEQPPIEAAEFVFQGENQSRVSALQAGEVDLAMAIAPESTSDVPQVIRRDGLEYPYLRLKNYEGPFSDELVRRAASLALNVPAYIENIYQGSASQANCQPNGDGVFGYNPDLEPYPYDPEEAARLVEESSYDGSSIRIVAPSGRWLKFEELAEAIAADLTAVGLNVDMQIVQFDPWLEEFVQPFGEGQPDAALSSFANELQDGDRISGFVGTEGAVSSYDAPEIAELLAQARVEGDLETREELYHEAYAAICEDVGLLTLLTFQDVYGAGENLQWTPRFDGTTRVEEMQLT